MNPLSFLTGRLWQVVAIALLAALLASSSYLGYQWYQAASARDTAVKDLAACNTEKLALAEKVGQLKTALDIQNAAIDLAAEWKKKADMRYIEAMVKVNKQANTINALRKDIENRPASVTCEGALKRQREAVDFLKSIRAKEKLHE